MVCLVRKIVKARRGFYLTDVLILVVQIGWSVTTVLSVEYPSFVMCPPYLSARLPISSLFFPVLTPTLFFCLLTHFSLLLFIFLFLFLYIFLFFVLRLPLNSYIICKYCINF